ncbi:unnamed protein product [Rotaria sp. Silwood1]|nr:unnamed protein product [Rotaria sp. Silwood1]CAF1462868.1 unnamed protein product [Rotaria sp. Silwood1]CAF3689306.1 unnamed protein product [Rotaria sp. Silwood1]CAF3717539.1 unnamed protein product [Rotaria sp. Silwood1]CAF3736707.1 unnamed protein product [Rotaria sp. Silwood1]
MGNRKSKIISPVTELTAKQIAEICRQTNLIDTEVRHRHSDFLKQYPNGLITREQLYESLNEVWPDCRIDKFASYLFATFDQDRNGTIDFVEFINITHKLYSNDIYDHNDDEQIFFGLLFDMFDRNHNGYLEKHELKQLIESIYDLSGLPKDERCGIYSSHAQVKYLLKKFDKNGDKRLSKQEFIDQANWIDDERIGRFFFSYYYNINNQETDEHNLELN